MGIQGSLEMLSLPEILQIISNGRKTGSLDILYHEEKDSKRELLSRSIWFKDGKIIGVAFPFNPRSLVDIMRKEGLLSANQLVKIHRETRNLKIPLGYYCLQSSFLSAIQVKSLFKTQLEVLATLFELEEGKFVFQDSEDFPLLEMTGESCEVTEIILRYMRSLSSLSKPLKQQVPQAHSGIIRLESDRDVSLSPIENCLLDDANGESSLKKIAQKTLFEISDLQQAALRLILIGLIDEVPVSSYALATAGPSTDSLPEVSRANKAKVKQDSSLFGNLVSFLRNKF